MLKIQKNALSIFTIVYGVGGDWLTLLCNFIALIKRLSDRWEKGTKRKFVHHMRKVHHFVYFSKTFQNVSANWCNKSNMGRKNWLTVMISMLKTHIAMTEGCNVQVCSHFFHLNASVDPTRRTILNLVVRRSVGCMALRCPAVGRRRRRWRRWKETFDAWEWRLLVGCPTARGGDDFRGGRCSGRRVVPLCVFFPSC